MDINPDTHHQANRESWLQSAVNKLQPRFRDIGYQLPEVQVSVGWTSKGSGRIDGQCWSRACSSLNVNQIFIAPTLSGPVDVLDCLVHELVHAIDDCQNAYFAPT